jgi:hypothetical protein
MYTLIDGILTAKPHRTDGSEGLDALYRGAAESRPVQIA